jgi:hypothetical protein
MANITLNLTERQPYDIPTKTTALAKFLFSRRSRNGSNVLEVIYHVLYDGTDDSVPERLWEAIAADAWRIEHFGISALGELVGWALPERYPREITAPANLCVLWDFR